MADLNTVRENMIENMIKFLADDCYVYIMTIGLDKYKKVMDTNDFYTFQMNLCSAFRTRIKDIYKDMGVEDPSNQTNKMYSDVVSNAIKRIQEEDHPFSVGLNVKQDTEFEIVFLKKKSYTYF
jgi:hypothetical protein